MSQAQIIRLSGPVVHARSEGRFRINEAVLVGEQQLLGEVIRIKDDELVLQVYEDTTGLRPGDSVRGSGHPVAINLGPALLGHIFDGLLRPLEESDSTYVTPGMYQAAAREFQFQPLLKLHQQLQGGERLGQISADHGRDQYCLIPPHVQGKLVEIADAGSYRDDACIAIVEHPKGHREEIRMRQRWPVRQQRPVKRRLPSDRPMLTGQRILDTLFPIARGGKAALPGGFGTGKTVLLETLAKWCDADVIVYVGCGERGNEMAGVLAEFPRLEDPRSGRPLMERTVIIANTSNMPVAAREASIYTGITVAEYFRDQGLHVALMADSTSRWAEALREVSGRLGELPGEGGYPAYLSSRLAEFYERAAAATTLNGDEASLTIMGAVSPPSGDFSEPVTTHTKRYVRCLWALDSQRAQARFYPAIHPLLSYSEDVEELKTWWKQAGNPDWLAIRRRFLTLLEEQSHLERMARIVGKDALPPQQQLTLINAELVEEGFLRQSALSPIDHHCSPQRQFTMMRLINRFIDRAEQAVQMNIAMESLQALPVLRRLRRMGEEIAEGDWERFHELERELESAFSRLEGESLDAS